MHAERPAFQAYEACISFLERALMRDTLPTSKLNTFCWILAEAYLRKGADGERCSPARGPRFLRHGRSSR